MSFSKSFIWGTAGAVCQIEKASNHYQNYREDVALLKQMGVKAYRFSVSWSFIMTDENQICEKNLQLYKNLVQELLDARIIPICTLCYRNLPRWLHEKGGWFCEQLSDYFARFTEIMVDALSDKLSIWMILNEVDTDVTIQTLEQLNRLTKNLLLVHGKAAQVIRKKAILQPQVGIAMEGTLIIPRSETKKEMAKARSSTFSEKGDFRQANWWLDPIVRGELHEHLAIMVSDEDREVICQPPDFIGLNCYKANNYDNDIGLDETAYPGFPRTAMDWPITPDALYWAVRFFHERYQLPILINENGMANIDFIMSDGRVHDQQRIEYLKGYLKGLKRAAAEGYPVMGYLYWSFLDNLEWAEGYDKRFGLIYVDYRNGKRIPKDSALWYTKTIRENGKSI